MPAKKKAGRPPRVDGAKSTCRIVIMVTHEERATLRALAREEKITISEFCRGRIADSLTDN